MLMSLGGASRILLRGKRTDSAAAPCAPKQMRFLAFPRLRLCNVKRIPVGTDVTEDRRASDRLPIIRHVRYKVLGEDNQTVSGSGKTVNISGSGVLFTTKTTLPDDVSIELVVSWPARLNGVAMELVLLGRLVRSEETQAAISISRYDFRTRG